MTYFIYKYEMSDIVSTEGNRSTKGFKSLDLKYKILDSNIY